MTVQMTIKQFHSYECDCCACGVQITSFEMLEVYCSKISMWNVKVQHDVPIDVDWLCGSGWSLLL